RVEPTREPGVATCDREDRPLETWGVVPEGTGARLALFDRLDHLTEWRVHDAPERDGSEHEKGVNEIVESQIVAERERTEAGDADREPVDARQPILASRPAVEHEHEEPEHHPERDGEEREVDAALVRDQGGDDAAEGHRAEDGDEQRQPEPARPLALREPEQVAADAEERAVSQPRQS